MPAQIKTGAYASGQLANVPGESVVLNRFGVYPRKIVRPAGPFLLYILNRLPGHTEHFSVTFDQDNAAELTGLDTATAKPNTSMLLDLQPGKYRIALRSRADLTLTVEIQ